MIKAYRVRAGDTDDDVPTVGAIIHGAHLSWCDGCGCYRPNHGKDFVRADGKQLCPKCVDEKGI
jgi:hypothetical protein